MPFPTHIVRQLIRDAFADVFAEEAHVQKLLELRTDIGELNLYPNDVALLLYVPALMDWLLGYPSEGRPIDDRVMPDMLLFYLERVLIGEHGGTLLTPDQRYTMLQWCEHAALLGVWRDEPAEKLIRSLRELWCDRA